MDYLLNESVHDIAGQLPESFKPYYKWITF